jgi:nucleotide-binding universal stress UspA family protein
MRVLVALDTSEVGERAAIAMAAWSRSVPIEVHLFSVIHPGDLDASRESTSRAEFPTPEGTEPRSVAIAQTGGGSGVVVSVPGDPLPATVEYRGQALESAKSEREDYLRGVIARHLRGMDPAVRVEFSDKTAEAIVETAKTLRVDAIAMATHGTGGIRHALMGSVAEQVMRQSPVPVVLVGPEARGESI